ncbi:hypothetical protein ACO0SA_004907 [Hanseniaspora valbyensis]
MSSKKDFLLPGDENLNNASTPPPPPPPPSYDTATNNNTNSTYIPYDFIEDYNKPISECNIYIRTIFTKRVFSLLSYQILATFLIQISFYTDFFPRHILFNPFIYWFSFIGAMATVVTLSFAITPIMNPDGEIMNEDDAFGGRFGWMISYNKQLALLGLFTVFESILVSFITLHYDPRVLMTAVFITLTIVITAYTISAYKAKQYEKKELQGDIDALLEEESTMSLVYRFLWCFTSGLFAFGFILMFLPHSSVAELIFSWVGALIFTVYLFIDMYMVFRKVRPNEEIRCCMMLYTDIINLFLNILRIVGHNNDN